MSGDHHFKTIRGCALGVLLSLGLFAGQAAAVDSSPAPGEAELTPIRAKIKAKDFKNAVEELHVLARRVQNADVFNLLGFSLRNLGDYEQSALYYRKALDYDADHKSALEYQGELFIKIGDMAKARQNLAKLEKLCPGGCEELDDLKHAIEAASK